ncbi:MAG: hypothetical protein GYA43_06775 [Bacteroidales bacterium]|nr:hypothetical protein [Bacteroidales bacterium]
MPSGPDAVELFLNAGILCRHGKAEKAGLVATSGLEIPQTPIRISLSADEANKHLRTTMKTIHDTCVKYGKKDDNFVSYANGAIIAGLVKVAGAMIAQVVA